MTWNFRSQSEIDARKIISDDKWKVQCIILCKTVTVEMSQKYGLKQQDVFFWTWTSLYYRYSHTPRAGTVSRNQRKVAIYEADVGDSV